MRTIIDLTAAQLERLDKGAAQAQISRAEAVRRAVDAAYPEEESSNSARQARRQAFGLWRARGEDALDYVNSLRDGWAR